MEAASYPLRCLLLVAFEIAESVLMASNNRKQVLSRAQNLVDALVGFFSCRLSSLKLACSDSLDSDRNRMRASESPGGGFV